MALFDSIIGKTTERFDLTIDQAKALISASLGLLIDPTTGGFSGFSSRFRNANLSDTVSSWTATGDNTPISKEQIESALGAETIAALADRAGLDYATTVSAMTFLLPQTIDKLTPNGEMPDEKTLRAATDDLDDEANDSAIGVRNTATEAFDRIGNATEDIAGKGHDMMSGSRISDSASGVDRVSAASVEISDQRLAENYSDEFNDDSPMKWLAPLIIVALLVAGGFWFCGKSSSAPRAKHDADFNFLSAAAIKFNQNKIDAG